MSWLILFFVLDADPDAGPSYSPSLPELMVLSAAVASAPPLKRIIKVSEPLEAPPAHSTHSYKDKAPRSVPFQPPLLLPLAIETVPSPGLIISKVVWHAPIISIPP